MLALLAAAAWWVWLGWGASWRLDQVSYATTPAISAEAAEMWRYLACGVTLAVVAVEGHRRLDPRLAGPALVIGFTGGCAADILRSDRTGLAAFSVLIVCAGMAKAATALRELAQTEPVAAGAGSRFSTAGPKQRLQPAERN